MSGNPLQLRLELLRQELPDFAESVLKPQERFGQIGESLHIAAYTYERAMQGLRWILTDDRWKRVGGGFNDVDAFIGSLPLAQFRKLTDERKEIVALVKKLQPKATVRAIAKATGVSHTTIESDLGNRLAKDKPKDAGELASSGNKLAKQLTGADAAKVVQKAEKKLTAAEAEKRLERLEKIAEISRGNADLSTATRYPIIYADPPWRYENPPIGSQSRAIENHYPTMTLDEICALPVAALAFDDALLYLWATAPKLAECMKVIEAWGFTYRTNMVWDKEKIGMGYHARNQHEILLIAKRGEIPPPLPGSQPSSVYRKERGEHSAKPIFYYEMIEAAYPQLPKIELFSRSPRAGWDAWGNQAEAA